MDNVKQGLAFGTGSAVAHNVIDSITGRNRHFDNHSTQVKGEVNEEIKESKENSQLNPCFNFLQIFKKCLAQHPDDLTYCQVKFADLNECNRQHNIKDLDLNYTKKIPEF